MTPHAAISAFNYLRAVAAGDTGAAREFAGTEPRMPALLTDVAERIVVPVTALPGPDASEPCEDTFALEALGRVFVTSLQIWTQAGPDTAEGIARAVIDFAAQFLTEEHEDVADTLRQLEAVGRGPGPRCAPRTGQLAPSAPDRHVVRTTRCRWCAPGAVTASVMRAPTHRTTHRGARHRPAAPRRARSTTGQAPISHTPLSAT
ncbi:hypothetical protein ACFYT4_35890 [Streptomyces sp. NPDC004609]|uniref:hypothetical protein n=1 Tax=Streptomyces sp. NPDC004609 TaxID=3364704 RepID=UPI0036BBA23F